MIDETIYVSASIINVLYRAPAEFTLFHRLRKRKICAQPEEGIIFFISHPACGRAQTQTHTYIADYAQEK